MIHATSLGGCEVLVPKCHVPCVRSAVVRSRAVRKPLLAAALLDAKPLRIVIGDLAPNLGCVTLHGNRVAQAGLRRGQVLYACQTSRITRLCRRGACFELSSAQTWPPCAPWPRWTPVPSAAPRRS
eukprot:scaffold558_cov120-Isochrysis_galbana.AAC.2